MHDAILILDFGSQYSHLIARRIRELNVYCELQPCTISTQQLQSFVSPTPESQSKNSDINFQVKGIILSGGPSSVYEDGAPHVQKEIWELGIPVLGICYGLQEMIHSLGGTVTPNSKREYGRATINSVENNDNHLFQSMPTTFQVWMSHGDGVTKLPSQDWTNIAQSDNTSNAGVANFKKHFYGLQFHPEVSHTPLGKQILQNFALNICHCKQDWNMSNFANEVINKLRNMIPSTDVVIGAVSGGVDSTVAAILLNKAIGTRFRAFLVDNGVLRLNESDQVMKLLKDGLGINLTLIDAKEEFLTKLAGVDDPEKKRKIIGNTFIEVFDREAKKIGNHATFLLQGTLYPDVIESVSYKGPSSTIKTHHNVGGLLPNMKLKLIEPFRELFKDEVRALGKELGLNDEVVYRHPFPGPGLAIRILGPISKDLLEILRHADSIFIEEIRKVDGLYRTIGQAFAVLLNCKSVGVMGDFRTYEQVIALRAVQTTDFMTADWYPLPYDLLQKVSTRIINEVKGVNRVVYDISSKPPSTIEWE